MDPPAPGACPLPRLPTSWLGPQPPLPPFNHPSISSASSPCWESLKQGWGQGAIHSCPLLPRQLGTGPWQWGKSTETFPRGLQGLQEHHPCSQIPAPGASQPRARQEDGSQKPLLLPRPRTRGPRKDPEMARNAEGSRYLLSPSRRLQEGPRTRPHASPSGAQDGPPLSRHRTRSLAAAPAGTPTALPASRRPRPRRRKRTGVGPGGRGLNGEGGKPGTGRAGPPRGGARTRAGVPGRGPAAELPVDLVREGAALGGRHGAARVPPLPPRAPSPPWSPPPPPPPGSGLPGLGGAGAGGGALPGVRGCSVLPLPAGGARGPRATSARPSGLR